MIAEEQQAEAIFKEIKDTKPEVTMKTYQKTLGYMNEYIKIMATKARRTLGFVKRLSKQINSPYTTKTVYIALVRPILEYCSTVWTPFTKNQIDNIESDQKQFILFALRHLG